MPRVPQRGGNWNNGDNAGWFACNLNNVRGNTNNNIGARPASWDRQKVGGHGYRHRAPHDGSHVPGHAPKPHRCPAGQVAASEPPAGRRTMKTHTHLFDQIADLDHLYQAYRTARQGHTMAGSHLRFAEDLGTNLATIRRRLLAGTWRTGPYTHFVVHEPKRRQIAALPFADRVVHHALHAVIEPIWEARYIHDSYACRVGKGTHFGIDRMQHMIRSCTDVHGRCYALKADIAGYFYSVDHATLKRLVRRHVACTRTLVLIDEIIDSPGGTVGIPIGNLTSQLFANIYLHHLDRHVKQDRRERWYARYMDDFAIFGPDKDHLHDLRRHLEAWLADELRLSLNHKTQVRPVSDAPSHRLDMLGYRIGPTVRRLRKTTLRRMHRGIRAAHTGVLRSDFDAFAASYRGMLDHERPRRREYPYEIAQETA